MSGEEKHLMLTRFPFDTVGRPWEKKKKKKEVAWMRNRVRLPGLSGRLQERLRYKEEVTAEERGWERRV